MTPRGIKNLSVIPKQSISLIALLLVGCQSISANQRSKPFFIKVIDDQTDRGVPLVELRTVDQVRFYTDSNGIAAIDDPVFNGRKVFFFVSSHGYDFPADFIGSRGQAMDVRGGASVTLKIHRLNIAERLYRITGEGIYRDSPMVGQKAPILQPLLDAEVTGQDTCLTAVYHNRIYWFFGDTGRLRYALGHFGTAGAVSQLPRDGGLDPAVGVDLKYFVNEDGFSRPMMPNFDQGLAWLDGLTVVKDHDGHEHMVGVCSNMKNLGEVYGQYLVQYNDHTDRFEKVRQIDEMTLRPRGQAVRSDVDGVAYFYYPRPFPNIRVKAEIQDVLDPSQYEAFTCLMPGEHLKPNSQKDWAAAIVERDASGKAVWRWKRDTSQLDDDQINALIKAGKLREDEIVFYPRDVQTHQYLSLHSGDAGYNTYRHKWIMIGQQGGGSTSFGGEIWYLEAERPEGPWTWARRIVTHDRYTFYNPVLHPFFEQAGGRTIYFEGTYSYFFSRDEAAATPRYDYNQMMYRLDLSDPRLLP